MNKNNGEHERRQLDALFDEHHTVTEDLLMSLGLDNLVFYLRAMNVGMNPRPANEITPQDDRWSGVDWD